MTYLADGVYPGQVQAALDASCAALLALRDASGDLADAGDEFGLPRESARQAIESVKEAIGELRRLIGVRAGSPLALGFAIADRGDELPGNGGQPNSLRMA
jgi:hypothetical protein